MSLLNQNEFSESDILRIINSQLEESINIEFKSANALDKKDSYKKEIAKDVSAFANSDGGLLFYGIDEKNHKASGTSFVDGNNFSKEWLENVIIANVQPRIDGLLIIPVRFGGDIEKSIYVLKIPRSVNGPHVSEDKRFYKRFNFQACPMEEYEIRGAYLKEKYSKVSLHRMIALHEGINGGRDYFKVELLIINQGQYVAEKYKVGLFIEDADEVTYDFDRSEEIAYAVDKDGIHISSTRMIPLFPGEIFTILRFVLSIPKSCLIEAFSSIKARIKVFDIEGMLDVPIALGKGLENAYWPSSNQATDE